MARKKKIGIEIGETFVPVGELVRYYRDGWYYGYLDSVAEASVRIRPIPAKGGVQPRSLTVAREDLKSC